MSKIILIMELLINIYMIIYIPNQPSVSSPSIEVSTDSIESEKV